MPSLEVELTKKRLTTTGKVGWTFTVAPVTTPNLAFALV